MKRCNGFFSFSIVTVAVLTLSLALTAATLAWQHFQMARTYEETVRLTYLAESALCEGWNQLRQDPDVLDTWFSSWLWPISVFDGISFPDNREIGY